MTYNTGNPIGSSDPRDMFDNAENLDQAVNSTDLSFTDRLGNTRMTLAGFAAAGFSGTNIYPDTAAGLAATTVGDYFNVPSALSSQFLSLYRHDAGSIATLVKTYPGLNARGKLDIKAMPFLEVGVNLFDLSARTDGAYVGPGGNMVVDEEFYASDFIGVKPGTQYTWSAYFNKFIVWYNASQAFISRVAAVGTAVSPAGAAFARISQRYEEVDPSIFMFVEGESLPSEYVPYQYVVTGDAGSTTIESTANKGQPGGYAGLDEDGKISPAHLPGSVSPLSGGTIVALGDSITYGFTPRNYPGYPGQLNSYLPLVADMLGASSINYGVSGSTLGDNGTGENQPFTQRYSAMDDSADLVIVMGGTNDVRKSVPLGTFGDTTDLTFYGALYVLCEGLLNKYRYAQGVEVGKTKKIMFMTAIKLGVTLNASLPSYNQATKEVCDYFSIPVFDAYNLSGLTPHLFRTVVGTEPGYTDNYNPYITDGTHPTPEGHEIFARNLAGFIRSLY